MVWEALVSENLIIFFTTMEKNSSLKELMGLPKTFETSATRFVGMPEAIS